MVSSKNTKLLLRNSIRNGNYNNDKLKKKVKYNKWNYCIRWILFWRWYQNKLTGGGGGQRNTINAPNLNRLILKSILFCNGFKRTPHQEVSYLNYWVGFLVYKWNTKKFGFRSTFKWLFWMWCYLFFLTSDKFSFSAWYDNKKSFPLRMKLKLYTLK